MPGSRSRQLVSGARDPGSTPRIRPFSTCTTGSSRLGVVIAAATACSGDEYDQRDGVPLVSIVEVILAGLVVALIWLTTAIFSIVDAIFFILLILAVMAATVALYKYLYTWRNGDGP